MWRLGFVTPSLESYLHFNKRIEQSHRIRQASAVVTIKNDKIGIETFFSILVLRIKVGIQPQLFSLAKDPCIFNFQKRLPILANLGEGLTPNFGQSFGILKGICSAMQLPMFFVRPAKWKKYFNLINSQKDASRTRAIEIFPYFSTQLSKKKDSNKADAILIASFYHETYQKDD